MVLSVKHDSEEQNYSCSTWGAALSVWRRAFCNRKVDGRAGCIVNNTRTSLPCAQHAPKVLSCIL